jgi:hypothetical protein
MLIGAMDQAIVTNINADSLACSKKCIDFSCSCDWRAIAMRSSFIVFVSTAILIGSHSAAVAGRWVATGWVTCTNCSPPDNRRQGYQIDRTGSGGGMKSKSECLKNLRSLEAEIRSSFLARDKNRKLKFERRCDYRG